jgi:hypothetical protein
MAVPGLADVARISFGVSHTCVLFQAKKTVSCWGENKWGQLGNGAVETGRMAPTEIVGLTDVVELAAGFEATSARTGDGSVFAWGCSNLGPSAHAIPTPLKIDGFSSSLVQITIDEGAILARRADGHVECSNGILHGVCDGAPVEIPAMYDAEDVTPSAWAGSSCVLGATTGLQCWGYHPGDGSAGPTSVPTHVAW